MVSKVFPAPSWRTRTLDFARRIAKLPTMTALLIKESVNETVDNQGFYNSLNACFTLHQLNHSHWAEIHDDGWPAAKPEDGVPVVEGSAADRPRREDHRAAADRPVPDAGVRLAERADLRSTRLGGDADPEALAHPQPLFKMLRDAAPVVDLRRGHGR